MAETRLYGGIVKRPTGEELFMAQTPAEQDAAIGKAAAEKIRAGEAKLSDFVHQERGGEAPGFLTQRPVEDL